MTTNQLQLRLNGVFITNGKAFRVFKIETEDSSGKTKRIIHYRPHYLNVTNMTLICSIPEENIETIGAREPISKIEMFKLLEQLSQAPEKGTEEIGLDQAKELLDQNNIHTIVRVLRFYNEIKNANDGKYTRAKVEIISAGIEKITEEVAFLIGVSCLEAQNRITAALEARTKNLPQ